MSLNYKRELIEIAKIVCRELRENSTEAEKIFWAAVRNRKFNGKKFYRQYPFFHDVTGKESFFVSDFFCFEENLIIELDGKYHKYRLSVDEKRTIILNHLGLRVIRFSNEEIISSLDYVLDKIKSSFQK